MTDIDPTISPDRGLSPVWIIPIVAIVIGLWMVIYAWMSQGPVVVISFKTAEGIEAGKTRIKYLETDIGKVKNVRLKKDMSGVVLEVQLDPGTEALLHEDSQFWVVRARVSSGTVSGLGTIISGAYIKLAPGSSEPGRRDFVGLETPPQTPVGTPGVRLQLSSKKAGSVTTGDLVLYRGYEVGRVEGLTFDEKRKLVTYDIFIDAPYDALVTNHVRFWDTSGISFNASAGGISLSTGSLQTVLMGAVSFDLPPGMSEGNKVEDGAQFKLFASREDMLEQPFQHNAYYVLSFNQSLRGLEPGSAVEYRGIRIGQVERIMFDELLEKKLTSSGIPIPVLISVQPGRLYFEDNESGAEQLDLLVKDGVLNGLRGSLQTGSLLTGKLFVNFDYYEDAAPADLTTFHDYQQIPTRASGFDRIEQQVTSFLDTVNTLPLNAMIGKVNQALDQLDGSLQASTKTLDSLTGILADSDTTSMMGELRMTLQELQLALSSFTPGSPTYQSLSSSIFELNRMLQNLDSLTRSLAEKPSALLLPSGFPADPQPKAKEK